MNNKDIKFAVIGAGHGGKAMAAHLALMGYDVALYNRTQEHVEKIRNIGGIFLEDSWSGTRGFGKLALVTSDIGEAIDGRKVIMVVVPANAHREIAIGMAPYLSDGQIVVLNPGRTFGAIEFRNTLREEGCFEDVIVAETQTFIYASRSEGEAKAKIFRIKDAVPLAALPASETEQVLEYVNMAYPQFVDGISILHTSLNNIGAIFHPAITLFNAGRIEQDDVDFEFYAEGVTPSVARIMEAIDRERLRLAEELGIQVYSAREWLYYAYKASGNNLYDAIHNQPGYRGIKAPKTLFHRYIKEDIPMSLVPLASLGINLGVPVSGMESLIHIANIVHKENYWQIGRTVQKLGIDNMTKYELRRYVEGKEIEPIQQPEAATYPVYDGIVVEPPLVNNL